MSSSLILTPFQRSVLRRLAVGTGGYQSKELSLLSLLTIFLVLETLEVSPSQIESILGTEVTKSLNDMLDARVSDSPGCAADPPILIVDGHRVPYFGVVNPDGRIAYTEAAQRWLQEHDHATRS